MKKEFVSYEQAVALKKLGFDELCIAGYDKDFIDKLYIGFSSDEGILFNSDYYTYAPLKQQVFKFFREKHNMLANIYSNASGFQYEYHDTIGGTHRFSSGYNGDCKLSGAFTTYEKAENACIDKLIELAKQQ